MGRNFFRRVEACFPVEDPRLKARLLTELETYLADNTQAWELGSDGTYTLLTPTTKEERRTVQTELLAINQEPQF